MTQIVEAKIGTSIAKLVKSLIKAKPKSSSLAAKNKARLKEIKKAYPEEANKTIGEIMRKRGMTSDKEWAAILKRKKAKSKKETMPIPQMKPKPKTKKPKAPVKPKRTAGEVQTVLTKKARGMPLSKREQRIYDLRMKSGKESDEGKYVYKGETRKIKSRPRSKETVQQPSHKEISIQNKLDTLEKKIRSGRDLTDKEWDRFESLNKELSTLMKGTESRVTKKTGGKVMKKRHGGMTRVGLSPAEEARSGTMSEANRLRYRAYGGSTKGSKPISTTGSYGGKKQLASWMSGLSSDEIKKILGITTRDPKTGIKSKLKTPKKKKKGRMYMKTAQAGGPIRTTFPERADPRKSRAPAVDLFPKVGRKNSGKVGSKKQGKGKHISSKQTDGNKLVASIYD